ncbi:unnamed protein product [Pylaiella littoralis]
METLFDATMTFLRIGIESEDGLTRLGFVQQRLQRGTDSVRDHCQQHRSKMEDPSTFKMMAEMVNEGIGQWTSVGFTRAVSFQKQHPTPPEIKHMPLVIGPQWAVIGDYIVNVVLPSTHSLMSPTKRPGLRKSPATGDNRCFVE